MSKMGYIYYNNKFYLLGGSYTLFSIYRPNVVWNIIQIVDLKHDCENDYCNVPCSTGHETIENECKLCPEGYYND